MTSNRTKAILVECDPGNTLGGACVRDVHNLAEYLISNNVTTDIQILLTDLSKVSKDLTKTVEYDSAKNILSVLDNLDLKSGDKLIVLVSGHGYTVADRDGDEIDRRDEYIRVGFNLKDDVLYEKIVLNNNVEGVQIILMSDTCHSGTMFDLPYSYDVYRKNCTKISKRNDDLEVNAVSIAACTDSQLSMCDFGRVAGFGGSLTVGLLEYPEVLDDLLEMRYDNMSTLFDRFKLLNQTGVLSLSHPV